MEPEWNNRWTDSEPWELLANGAGEELFLRAAVLVAGGGDVMPRSLTVTIADDEPAVRETLERLLAALGHAVVASATNGQELLEQCQRRLPELAIIDLEMPVLDGLATAEDLRAISPVPIILLSGHPDFAQVVRQHEPIEVYLSKPVTLGSLRRAIEQAVPQTVGG